MSIQREELHRIIDMLPDDKLPKMIDVLSAVHGEDDEPLSELERKQIDQAEIRIAKGEYVTLDDLLAKYGAEENDV